MLTKEQHLFLIDFAKKAKENANGGDDSLTFSNKAAVRLNDMVDLLTNHPNLHTSQPFNANGFNNSNLVTYIDKYVGEVGLEDCFVFEQPRTYSLTIEGQRLIEEYEDFQNSKANAKKALRHSLISIVISVISALIAIAAIIVSVAAK